jgi:hypothetical protein
VTPHETGTSLVATTESRLKVFLINAETEMTAQCHVPPVARLLSCVRLNLCTYLSLRFIKLVYSAVQM